MPSFRQALISIAVGRLAVGEEVDQLPIVNVRLGPPANALPQVAAEISLLESARKDVESTRLQELDLAFQQAVNHASSTLSEMIPSALGRISKHPAQHATSLLEVRNELVGKDNDDAAPAQTFAIDVRSPREPDLAIKAKLDQIEQKRSIDEGHIFEQAAREFAALEKIFTSEVLAQLNAHAAGSVARNAIGFLQTSKDMRRSGSGGLPEGLNVRLSASAQPFPTIEGLALAMEGRRDASEEIIRNRILELESHFFETANGLLREALRGGSPGTA